MRALPSAKTVFGITNMVGSFLVTAGAWMAFGPDAGLVTLGALMIAINFAEVLLGGRR